MEKGSGKELKIVGLMILCLVMMFPPAGAAQESKLEKKRFTNSLGMDFIKIPPGSFIMGSPEKEQFRNPDETPHLVRLSRGFFMQETEVTQAQWRAVMGSNPSFFKDCGDNCPVERVSWNDVARFLEALNKRAEGIYRLPTEAEWEYACRAGTKSAFSWGDSPDCTRGMFSNNPRRGVARCLNEVLARGLKAGSPAPVRSYAPNPWGLYDMHGNLWEWCQDWYGPYPQDELIDPQGPAQGTFKVRRGGSWFKYATFGRSANRTWAHPASRYNTTGFRLVRELD
ncbi:MAG: formylglycine-generating enzyme family protein [bacterium]